MREMGGTTFKIIRQVYEDGLNALIIRTGNRIAVQPILLAMAVGQHLHRFALFWP